jgi:RNA polymerase subunit RPABC4/transcription elongation factor Spt4
MCKPQLGEMVVACDNSLKSVSIWGESTGANVAPQRKLVNIPSGFWLGLPTLGVNPAQVDIDLHLTLGFEKKATSRRKYDIDIRVEPDLSTFPVAYSSSERAICGPAFHSKSTCDDWTGMSVTLEADKDTVVLKKGITVPTAGNNSYIVSARDCGGKIVQSGFITVRRVVFLKVFRGDDDKDHPLNFDGLRRQFDRLGIDLEIGDEVKLPTVAKNVPGNGSEGRLTWAAECKGPYVKQFTSLLEPYVAAVFVVNQFNWKSDLQLTQPGISVGPGAAEAVLPIVDGNATTWPLWHFIDDGRTWLKSAKFVSDDTFEDHPFDAFIDVTSELLAAATEVSTNGLVTSLRVRFDQVHTKAMTGTLTLELSCGQLQSPFGFVPAGKNFIGLSRYHFGNLHDARTLEIIITHELGHMIGMVPGGYPKPKRLVSRKPAQDGVDEHAYYYDQHDNSVFVFDVFDSTMFTMHRGPHCHYPLSKPVYDNGMPLVSCVMLGQVGANAAFCDLCVEAGRKVDFRQGFQKFYT